MPGIPTQPESLLMKFSKVALIINSADGRVESVVDGLNPLNSDQWKDFLAWMSFSSSATIAFPTHSDVEPEDVDCRFLFDGVQWLAECWESTGEEAEPLDVRFQKGHLVIYFVNAFPALDSSQPVMRQTKEQMMERLILGIEGYLNEYIAGQLREAVANGLKLLNDLIS